MDSVEEPKIPSTDQPSAQSEWRRGTEGSEEGAAVITSEPVKRKRTTKPKKDEVNNIVSMKQPEKTSSKVAIATFGNIKTLTSIFKLLAEIIGDGNMKFTPDGIYISGMDPSHACLLRVCLGAEMMIYQPMEHTTQFGVSFKILAKILGTFQSASMVTIKVGEIADKMDLTFVVGSSQSEFQVSLMNIDMDELEIPPIEYSANIDIITSVAKDFVSQAEKLEVDSMTLRYTGKELRMKYSTTILKGDLCMKEDTEAGSPVETVIATKYIKSFFSSGTFGEMITIKLGREQPMLLRVGLEKLGGGDSSDSFVEFYISPRITDDGDDVGGEDDDDNIVY